MDHAEPGEQAAGQRPGDAAAGRTRPSIRWARIVPQSRLVTMNPPESIVTVWTQCCVGLGELGERLPASGQDLVQRRASARYARAGTQARATAG